MPITAQAKQVIQIQVNPQQALQLDVDEAHNLIDEVAAQLRAIGHGVTVSRKRPASKAPAKKAARKK